MNLQVKKKNFNWLILIQVLILARYQIKTHLQSDLQTHERDWTVPSQPLSFRAKTEGSISIMEEMKKKKIRTTTVFATTKWYNYIWWPKMEEFPLWQGGWISLRLSAKLHSSNKDLWSRRTDMDQGLGAHTIKVLRFIEELVDGNHIFGL